ncbi:CAP domain-containing protein [Tautonia plasticadhaerens]|uniref:Hemolysin, plasmid n=1 Tax=Tautonia plasticadhaerens TaxID=2527974 RepID=A0A518H928_9BACT|nr:CAP domain-containing protein [Tautonia plasticadhaerens]QDV37236.1 Hemolysin, plasmid [Tautonia plasticadhaerens]
MPHPERRRSFRPRCESLDDRTLLSATPTAQIVQGVLFVTGTESADVIDVTVRPYRLGRTEIPIVRVSGTPRWFNGMRFQMVVVDARGGDDFVRINDGGRPLKPSWLDGGAGDDTLIGGSADDVILGGFGDDAIAGLAGLDRLDGGPGRDLINGVPDPDPIAPAPVEPPPVEAVPVVSPSESPADPAPTQSPITPEPPTADSPAVAITREEQVIVDLTNQARADQGLAPLSVDARLQRAAQIHAENMARLDRLAHELPETGTPTLADRARAAGYRYSMLGENIAFNYYSPSQAVDGWLDSEGHRRNILTSEYTQLGVSLAYNASGQPYYIQVFGRPA